MKKNKKKTSQKQGVLSKSMKASAMILEFASDYILMGENLEERQSAINSACSAWNLALFPDGERTPRLWRYMDEIRQANPGIEEDELADIQFNVELLIKEKLRLFPQVRKKMLHAEIVEVNGEEKVTVLSADT
jgi:hypothetical protein